MRHSCSDAERAADALRKLALDEGVKAALSADPQLAAIARRVADPYIAGDSLDEAIASIRAINARGHRATVDAMGESCHDLESARQATATFVETSRRIAREGLDCSLSLDLSNIGLTIDRTECLAMAREIASAAKAIATEMIISAEGSDRTDEILDLHGELCGEFDNVGIRVQARLHRTERDLATVLARPGRICLVKGAFHEPLDVAIAREDPGLAEVYATYATRLIRSGHQCSIATHEPELQALAVRELAVCPEANAEFEVLLGLGDEGIDALRSAGQTTRIYVVFGDEWFLYVCNRLAEKPERIYRAVVDAIS